MDDKGPNKRTPLQSLLRFFFFMLLAIILINIFLPKQEEGNVVSLTTFEQMIKKGQITSVVVHETGYVESKIPGENEKVVTVKAYCLKEFLPSLGEFLQENNVHVQVKKQETSFFGTLLISCFPMLLLIGMWFWIFRRSGQGGPFSFGKSKARVLQEKVNTTFNDVAGMDEAKREVTEIIEFMKEPKKFIRLGGKMPKGVLLVGAPGTGKTLLARALAGEAGVPFFSISGSEFVEMFVGVGASRVRDLFEQAKKNAPCIIFIDELDAVGRHRGAGIGGGHDEREQTLNQILVNMDGLEENDYAIVLAATNRPDVLDPALLRPGRFDRQVVIPLPDIKGREAILKVHAKGKPLADNVDLEKLAQSTPGFSGADLANLLNEAALYAARRNAEVIDPEDFENARDKIIMGVENKIAMSPREKEMIAYHEVGHGLVAKLTPGADPVHKISIIPRGLALGATQQRPEGDKYLHTKESLLSQIKILLGGRVAEELMFNDRSTGAANDLERATDIAKRMVTEWGMSEAGLRTFGRKSGNVFLGREIEIATQKDYSDKTAAKIDEEIDKIIKDCYEATNELIRQNMSKLKEIAKVLLKKETIEQEEFDSFFT